MYGNVKKQKMNRNEKGKKKKEKEKEKSTLGSRNTVICYWIYESDFISVHISLMTVNPRAPAVEINSTKTRERTSGRNAFKFLQTPIIEIWPIR